MNKVMKIFAVMFLALVVISTSTSMVFASGDKTPLQIVEDITPSTSTDSADKLVEMAGKVIGLIQLASAVAAVILIAVFGFKFILGSASEKAEYQKSFMPLIVGVVVVFAATSIAKLLFGVLTPTAEEVEAAASILTTILA